MQKVVKCVLFFDMILAKDIFIFLGNSDIVFILASLIGPQFWDEELNVTDNCLYLLSNILSSTSVEKNIKLVEEGIINDYIKLVTNIINNSLVE